MCYISDGQIYLCVTYPYTVLEPTGVPVTGTSSISLEFNFIINRWTIYITTFCLIDRWLAIYKCFIFFDLHMHQVTSFKHWSPILPSAAQTLGDIIVYVSKFVLPLSWSNEQTYRRGNWAGCRVKVRILVQITNYFIQPHCLE